MKRKNYWLYVIILAAILILYLALGNINKSQTNSSNNLSNPPGQPAQNQESGAAKNSSTLTYYLDWQRDYIDLPNNIVTILISGNYNQVNISSKTEVARITVTGTNNKITICNSTFAPPQVQPVGVNNKVSYIVC